MIWKHWVLGFGLAMLMSVDGWSTETRTTVDLRWRHLPRTEEGLLALQTADLPDNGRITWAAWSSGMETLKITLPSGVFCITTDDRMIVLRCGSAGGFWSASKLHNKTTEIEWVSEPTVPVKGEKS